MGGNPPPGTALLADPYQQEPEVDPRAGLRQLDGGAAWKAAQRSLPTRGRLPLTTH